MSDSTTLFSVSEAGGPSFSPPLAFFGRSDPGLPSRGRFCDGRSGEAFSEEVELLLEGVFSTLSLSTLLDFGLLLTCSAATLSSQLEARGETKRNDSSTFLSPSLIGLRQRSTSFSSGMDCSTGLAVDLEAFCCGSGVSSSGACFLREEVTSHQTVERSSLMRQRRYVATRGVFRATRDKQR